MPTNNTRLHRRGFSLGEALLSNVTSNNETIQNPDWETGEPIYLKQQCLAMLAEHTLDIAQASALYKAVLDDAECDALLDESPYIERLETQFESLGSSFNEGDDQEIETVLFDAIDSNNAGSNIENANNESTVLAEDLWMKASWLSFYDEDASLRFRFSFGVDLHEDVAADTNRQHYSALLADAVFPESTIVTQNTALLKKLTSILGCDAINFVERIVYFNAPEGGAYLHHDRERGHAGVVYAQLSGSTFWLALTRLQLVTEVISFIQACEKTKEWPASISADMQAELSHLATNSELITEELESFCNSTLIHVINETEAFVQQLIQHGHGKILQAGDMLLLPQETPDTCCWHSVFTLGEETGQALSFAIRKA